MDHTTNNTTKSSPNSNNNNNNKKNNNTTNTHTFSFPLQNNSNIFSQHCTTTSKPTRTTSIQHKNYKNSKKTYTIDNQQELQQDNPHPTFIAIPTQSDLLQNHNKNKQGKDYQQLFSIFTWLTLIILTAFQVIVVLGL